MNGNEFRKYRTRSRCVNCHSAKLLVDKGRGVSSNEHHRIYHEYMIRIGETVPSLIQCDNILMDMSSEEETIEPAIQDSTKVFIRRGVLSSPESKEVGNSSKSIIMSLVNSALDSFRKYINDFLPWMQGIDTNMMQALDKIDALEKNTLRLISTIETLKSDLSEERKARQDLGAFVNSLVVKGGPGVAYLPLPDERKIYTPGKNSTSSMYLDMTSGIPVLAPLTPPLVTTTTAVPKFAPAKSHPYRTS